jgi:hypothetical protein
MMTIANASGRRTSTRRIVLATTTHVSGAAQVLSLRRALHSLLSDLIVLINDADRRPLMNETAFEFDFKLEFSQSDFKNGAVLKEVLLMQLLR